MSVPLPKAVAGWSNTARRTALLLLSGLLLSAPLCATANAQTVSAERPSRADSYATFITEAAQRFGIPEHWIRAVMRVESAGDVRAISSAGAMGLMQIMPATWAVLSARYGLGDDPYDRRANIMAGAAYIREMHDRYGAPGFLAAYNAGLTPVARWNAEINDQGDPLLWMESIPYWETRGYVGIVLRNYWMYEAQQGKPSVSRAALAQGKWPRFPDSKDRIRLSYAGGMANAD